MAENQPKYRNLEDEEFRVMFLQTAQRGTQEANDFFGSFKYVYELFQGNYSEALNQGISLLNKCRSINNQSYEAIHKGTPFYWLGTAAYLVHDHETATFFYDAAVSEDLRAGADPVHNSTPALRFIQIEGEPREQAARQLVLAMQARIEEVIYDYNSRPGRSASVHDLTLPEIRESFLSIAVMVGHERLRSLASAFLSFIIEWDYRNTLLDLRAGAGTIEPFFLHLFKGCVLFESLLKANPSQALPANAITLGRVLSNLYLDLGIPNNLNIGGANFQAILQDLMQRDDSIQTAIELTGKIRNTVGHDLGWVIQLDKIQYHRLFRMVTASCLHSIACLYR